jgi:hypothetical protein
MIRWILLIAVAGCAGKIDAPPPPKMDDWVAPLMMKDGLPLAHALVAGEPSWLLVDTGASYHFVSDHLAGKVTTLSAEPHEVLGRRQEVRMSSSAPIEIGSWSLVTDGVFLTDLARLGSDIAGVISPQWIATRGGTVALDLVARELRWMPGDEAKRRYAGWLTTGDLQMCAPEKYSTRYTMQLLVGGTPATLLVDTGAPYSALDLHRPPGQLLANGPSQQIAVMGSVERSIRVATYQAAPDPCMYDGVLGAEALTECAILFDGEAARVLCRQNLAAQGSSGT